MYIVEEEADDPEGKKRRQVILKRAGLQGRAEPSETGATGSELSGRGGPWLGVHVQSGGGAVETLQELRWLFQVPGLSLCEEELKTGERGPRISLPSPGFPFSSAICLQETNSQLLQESCLYLQGINPKTPSGCLKSQIVLDPVYTMLFPRLMGR